MGSPYLDFILVAALGGVVGAGELVSRYRDAPTGALRSGAAAFYIFLNVAASLAALALIHAFGWTFGVTSGGAALRWTQVGVAGTGAMACSELHSSPSTLATATSASDPAACSRFSAMLRTAASTAYGHRTAAGM